MPDSLLVLFHFLTFTFGFTSLVLISRRSIRVPLSIRKSFINQTLFYNLTIVFMTIADFMILISGDELFTNRKELVFYSVIINTNNIFYVLWCLSFIKLVYSMLEKQIYAKTRIFLTTIAAVLLLLILYNVAGTIMGDVSYLQKITTEILCFIPIVVTVYSLYITIAAGATEDLERRKALKAFGLLFSGFSVILILFYADLIFLKLIPEKTGKMVIYGIDFTFNVIIVYWSLRYLDYLADFKVTLENRSLTGNEIISKYQISKREQEIIRLVCEGKSNQEIADELFISLGTVKNHLYNIYLKLNIRNRTQLVKMF